MICGLIVPTSGSITINGKRLGKDITFPKSVGILIENPAFLAAHSDFENLKLLASIKNRIGAEKICEVLALVVISCHDLSTLQELPEQNLPDGKRDPASVQRGGMRDEKRLIAVLL